MDGEADDRSGHLVHGDSERAAIMSSEAPHLPRLLETVAKGERITITRHGVPVAILAPPAPGRKGSPGEVIDKLRRFRRGRSTGGRELKRMIEELATRDKTLRSACRKSGVPLAVQEP